MCSPALEQDYALQLGLHIWSPSEPFDCSSIVILLRLPATLRTSNRSDETTGQMRPSNCT